MRGATQTMGRALLGALVLAWMATAGWSQSLTWLGVPPGGFYWSESLGVSSDGVTVVGWAYPFSGGYRAFRWTPVAGMQDLGTLGGTHSEAWDVSSDGSVVVGLARNASGNWRAFRWTQAGGMQDLGTLGGCCSWGYGVSADGSVVVGGAADSAGIWRAFRWTAESGMQSIDTLNSRFSVASGVSADGAVVVGRVDIGRESHAFRWTLGTGMQDLGTLSGGDRAWAYAVSSDGSVVVGEAEVVSPDGFRRYSRAFRWTEEAGMQDIGAFREWSRAYGVSSDGSIVVGSSDGRAFRWRQGVGMEDLNITYSGLLRDGSVLYTARDISPDGRYIVGYGRNAATGRYEAFLLDTQPSCTAHNGDVDSNGCVDDADLLAVLFAFGGTGSNLGRVDVNCDGVVDDADLLQVLFNFGSGC